MTREQREKLSSEGIAIKYQCPKTGKDKVSLTQHPSSDIIDVIQSSVTTVTTT